MYLHADIAVAYLNAIKVPETQIDKRESTLRFAQERLQLAETELATQDEWMAQIKNALQEYEVRFTEFKNQNSAVEELSSRIREEFPVGDELPYARRSYSQAHNLIQQTKSPGAAQDIIDRFERDFIAAWRRATEAEMTAILQASERSNPR
jgi:hypothetical protein